MNERWGDCCFLFPASAHSLVGTLHSPPWQWWAPDYPVDQCFPRVLVSGANRKDYLAYRVVEMPGGRVAHEVNETKMLSKDERGKERSLPA